MWRELVVSTGLLLGPGAVAADSPAPGTASVPVETLLELYEARDRADESEVVPPPVVGAVRSAALRGRVLDDALDLRARFELSVLPPDGWAQVPLLEVGPGVVLTDLPRLPVGLLTVTDGRLTLVTDEAGDFALEVGWMQSASRDGELRRVRVDVSGAMVARLDVQADESLFDLRLPEGAQRGADGVVIPSNKRRFDVSWRRLAPSSPVEVVERPPVEPVIARARAAAVSTLEGHATIQVLYEAELEGEETLGLEIPKGIDVERAYLNGAAVAFDVVEGRLELAVRTGRAGERGARLELTLRTGRLGYLLAGNLEVALPATSWPIHEVFLELHLPSVFDYVWCGGSLAPIDLPRPASFTHQMPRPGEHLAFHQHLVTGSSPSVRLRYEIDLDGRYFVPGASTR